MLVEPQRMSIFTYSAFALYDVISILRKLLGMVFDERSNNVFPAHVKN